MIRPQSPIRWRADVGWEYRCEDCVRRARACFWPLADEFWDYRRGMRRCRACYRAHDAARARARYRGDTTFRERRRSASRRYHAATRAAQRIRSQERWLETLADPTLHAAAQARSRETSRRYRERRRAA